MSEELANTEFSSGIRVEQFSEIIDDKLILGQIMFLNKSCWIWLSDGRKPASMESLVVSMPTIFNDMPISSKIFDSSLEESVLGEGLAQRLSKKFNIQCFVSVNIGEELEALFVQVESKVISMLASNFNA
jgi:hypothetical protein